VLLPSSSRVLAVLGTTTVRVDVLAGWPTVRRVASEREPVGGAALTDAIDALDPVLKRLRGRGKGLAGATLSAVVADAWMMYDVIEGDWSALPPDAAGAMIGAALADVAGSPPGELATRWQRQGANTRAIACGLPAAAASRLEQLCTTHGVRLGSVVGEFVHEFNAARARLEAPHAVIAVVRDGGAQLAVALDGALAAFSFEQGVNDPHELEARGRGLLRTAGVEPDTATRFYVLMPKGSKVPSPWVAVPPVR